MVAMSTPPPPDPLRPPSSRCASLHRPRRKQISVADIYRRRLCFRCLYPDHPVRECRDPPQCRLCRQSGHRGVDCSSLSAMDPYPVTPQPHAIPTSPRGTPPIAPTGFPPFSPIRPLNFSSAGGGGDPPSNDTDEAGIPADPVVCDAPTDLTAGAPAPAAPLPRREAPAPTPTSALTHDGPAPRVSARLRGRQDGLLESALDRAVRLKASKDTGPSAASLSRLPPPLFSAAELVAMATACGLPEEDVQRIADAAAVIDGAP